jgi:hypothetical protein
MSPVVRATRQSRYRRATTLPGLLLTGRHRRIIVAVATVGFLLRSQIQRLFDMDCVSRMNAILRKLYDHGFLDRRFLPVSLQSKEALYFLGRNGIPFVVEALGQSSAEVAAQRHRCQQLTLATLLHDVQVNDVRVAVMRQAKTLATCELLCWRGAPAAVSRFDLTKNGKTAVSAVKPDGFFQVAFQLHRYSFCLELDRSTSSHPKLQAKFQAYIAFFLAGLHRQAYGASTVYVLVVCPSPRRRDELKAVVERLDSRQFFFAVRQDVCNSPLTAPVWYRAGDAAPRSLFSTDQAESP